MSKRSIFFILLMVFVGLVFSYSFIRDGKNNVKNQTLKNEPTLKTLENKIAQNYGKLPLSFEKNSGQADAQVQYLSRGKGYKLYITENKATLSLGKSNVVEMQVVGAKKGVKAVAEDELEGKSNYFVGNDPSKWKTNISHYKKVRYQEIYDGIDLVYYGNQESLEYDFVVKPGVDPDAIKLRFSGTSNIKLDENGNLVLKLEEGEVIQKAPYIYQTINGSKQEIEGGYQILANNEVSFLLKDYDHTNTLVIDPEVIYSTFIGGTNVNSGDGDERAFAVTVDKDGNVIVAGQTSSRNFPITSGVVQSSLSKPLPRPIDGEIDGFITKLNPTGTALIFSTFLGGPDGSENIEGIDVDIEGNIYVAGTTNSLKYPATGGAFQPVSRETGFIVDGFVSKLNSNGSALIYSTYLSGEDNDIVNGLAVDSVGNAYIVGRTQSKMFPTSNALQPTASGSFMDGFVTKLNASGTGLIYSTYLGGANGQTFAFDVAVDATGNAYITGFTESATFPTTTGAFQTTIKGMADVFITKFNPGGNTLAYSTFLGSSSSENGLAIAIDEMGNAYVTGFVVNTNDFPVTPGVFQPGFGGGFNDTFITKLNPTGTALVFSTFLGAGTNDEARGIAVDKVGNVVIAGLTTGAYPTTRDAFQPSPRGNGDGFLSQLSASGRTLLYSTHLGGSGNDGGLDVAIDPEGNAIVVGSTASANFPVTSGVVQPTFAGGGAPLDIFVTKISLAPAEPPPPTTASLSANSLNFTKQNIGTTSAPKPITVTNTGPNPLIISKIEITGDFAQTSNCTNGEIAPGRSCVINVVFTPTGAKKRLGTMTITDSTTSSPKTVSLKGKGK